ncbi:MAG: nuclear transport factor 2 family protein [Gemmatimonadales bacterium]
MWKRSVFAAALVASPLHAQAGPADAVAAFHAALAAGDSAAAVRWLDPDVVIFESGGAELSAAEYAGHHLPGDMAFAVAVTRTVEDQQVHEAGDVAWVATRSRTTGTYRDRAVDVRGTETMILRRTATGWRIVHVHWSSRRATP